MKRTILVRIFRGETKFVAECLDLPVVTEGTTLDELASNIREAIALPSKERISVNSDSLSILRFS